RRGGARVSQRGRTIDSLSRHQTGGGNPVLALRCGRRPPMSGYLSQNYPLINAFRSAGLSRDRRAARALNRVFKMAPKLSDYFERDEIVAHKGELDRPISGIVMDSRRVVPGNVFFALPGLRTDGSG